MLNAAEVAIDQAAEDDGERQRNKAKLYAPPKGYRPAPGERLRVPGAGMTATQARSLSQQLAAEDSRLARRLSG